MMRFRPSSAAAVLALLAMTSLATAAEKPWYHSPTLSVMTGHVYEPKSRFSMQQWLGGLGNKTDADRWVADFKEAGATYLISCDK